jgi:hypothetical protein
VAEGFPAGIRVGVPVNAALAVAVAAFAVAAVRTRSGTPPRRGARPRPGHAERHNRRWSNP